MPNQDLVRFISDNYRQVMDQALEAIHQAKRSTDELHIIAVSKTKPLSMIRAAKMAGVYEFAENKVQEFLTKAPQLMGGNLLHFVGHLQSNKANKLIPWCNVIHSIDKWDTARSIDRQLQQMKDQGLVRQIDPAYFKLEPYQMACFIQVNTTDETSKFGISPEKLPILLDSIAELQSIVPVGLMTIGPTYGASRENRRAFSLLARLRDQQQQRTSISLPYLSMGMSGDFQDAIAEGATHIRIGTAIFGDRDYA